MINYRWDNIDNERLNFKLDYDVRVNNYLRKIDKKIKFPLEDLNEDLLVYTNASNYIDINEDIIKTASSIVEGETDYYLAVFKIADWVKNNIEYDLSTLTAEVVQKSSWVLVNKQGVCDEITNLFISMLRSVNIPARFVTGVVYSNINNNFGNHGWAEVYFPGYGWVPFDVTFGQYAWIDPSHVKLSDTLDSGSTSIDYSWRAYKTKLETNEIEIKTTVIKEGGATEQLAEISIDTLKQEVSFGSYMPLQVKIKNLKNYYVPLTLYVTKAPGLFDSNIKNIILRPNEEKSIFWILKIDENLDENYVYKSEINVNGDFSNTANSQISYAKGYRFYNLNWAKSRIDELREDEDKEFLPDLDFICSSDKNKYYSRENIVISCKLNNNGNVNLENIKICLNKNCKKSNLRISEKVNVDFNLSLNESKRLVLSAESNEMIKYSYIDIYIVEVPNVDIIDLEPESIQYNKVSNLSFSLITNTKLSNVTMQLNGLEVKLDDFDERYDVTIPITGRFIKNDRLNIKVKYGDELGKIYEKAKTFYIKVERIPWYIRLLRLIRASSS